MFAAGPVYCAQHKAYNGDASRRGRCCRSCSVCSLLGTEKQKNYSSNCHGCWRRLCKLCAEYSRTTASGCHIVQGNAGYRFCPTSKVVLKILQHAITHATGGHLTHGTYNMLHQQHANQIPQTKIETAACLTILLCCQKQAEASLTAHGNHRRWALHEVA